MTDEQALISQIHKLPENQKAKVARYVEKLRERVIVEPVKKHPRRKAGSYPGMFVMSPDFDEPLEEFEEYM